MHFSEGFELNSHLVERWGQQPPKFKSLAFHQPVRASVPANQAIRNYVFSSQSPVNAASWLSRREIPTSAELLGTPGGDSVGDQGTPLRFNRIRGPWQSKEEYLSTHYELLREDAVGPLRIAVDKVRNKPSMNDGDDVCIYENTYIIGATFSNKGPAFRVQFSLQRAGKKINWAQSKRLKQGTMVALTPVKDMFKTQCIVATVAARPLLGLEQNPAEVDLFFAVPEEIEFDPQQEWVMVESRAGYFEAYRHTLLALQKIMRDDLPFTEHLLNVRTAVDAPSYLKRQPLTDLSSIFAANDLDEHFENVDLLRDSPTSPQTELDRSQLAALRQILTKELAVVQGPPGTGKTHVSVVALKALLQNTTEEDPPIIISAHTNHALDQLLRHVAEFEPNFIRLGGRTLDQDLIKKRTLYEVRRSTTVPALTGGLRGSGQSKLKRSKETLISLLGPLLNQKEPMPAVLFFEIGLISEAQYKSLEEGASDWVRPIYEDQPAGAMATWLGDGLAIYNRTFQRDNLPFEYEEVDLEFEQLKELEAETKGATDDEDLETLKGSYVCFTDHFLGRRRPGVTVSKLSKALETQDMWNIPESIRGAVYSSLHQRAKEAIRAAVREEAVSYMKAVLEIKIGSWEQDAVHLQKAKVIGMTTTGLSKNRALLASLEPRIVLIEEAAETLEAPVTAACMESVEHLILVGDHKQLRGNCATRRLEGKPYHLAVSMFERLVDNHIEFSTLTRQRRMIPEIRRILAPIYEVYHDHPSVIEQEPVQGMGGVNSYFFSHNWYESKDQLMSTYNQKEADMIVGFFNYLVLNGVKTKSITILTFYNGQRKLILKGLRNHPSLEGNYFNVVTVDSYQGEENDIVLLSLVRSNAKGNIGFLEIKNRVCVALSRAKRGFYIFGNGEKLCQADLSKLWFKVLKIMASKPRRIGYALPIECQTHGRRNWLQDPLEWSKVNYGGCEMDCTEPLACGHLCPLTCHPFSHKAVKCHYPCERVLKCEHRCLKMCFETCRCICTDSHENTAPSALNSPPEGLSRGFKLPPNPVASSPSKPVPQPRGKNAWSSNNTSPERRAGGAESWTAYASGGVVESDALLQAEAKRASAHERQRNLDEYNMRTVRNPPVAAESSLLIDFGSSEPTPTPTPTRVFSDGNGGFRAKWKGTYTVGVENVAGGQTRTDSAPVPPPFNLLD
ncbi:MAG: hypothetical protein M1812_004696 [Candelaria pacifica]|nr:MAG: hypothetical protein M1812_004696 [Candelaria pacifica]